MTDSGNTGVAGGTKGADPVPPPEKTAPDRSTVLGPPDPPGGEQNRGYRNGNEKGVDDDGRAVG